MVSACPRWPASRQQLDQMMTILADEIVRWRRFTIVSRPDAEQDHLDREIAAVRRGDTAGGGGARRPAAGALGLDGGRARAQHLGLSAVMSFDHQGLVFNLLDTPGHEDFSEDTYAR